MSNYTNEQMQQNGHTTQTIIVQEREKNTMGIAGFVLSIVSYLIFWLPVLSVITWILGLIFSSIGIFRKPKGFAIAGLVISLVGIIIGILLGGLAMFAVLNSEGGM